MENPANNVFKIALVITLISGICLVIVPIIAFAMIDESNYSAHNAIISTQQISFLGLIVGVGFMFIGYLCKE